MKRWLGLALLLVVLAGGYLVGAHLSGGAWPVFGLPLGGDRERLRETTRSFWEDIQFKDFDRAASYHDPDRQAEVDIPYLIERLFLQKPEAIEIIDYEITYAEVDSTGLRARVKTRVRARDLLREKVDDREVMLYFHRASAAGRWYMELESSLRKLDPDPDKKH